MYELVNTDDVREGSDGETPAVRWLSDDLDTEELRPAVWEYAAGDEGVRHRHEEQEEFYYVLSGTLEVTLEDDEGEEVLTLETDDALRVSPDTWRRLEAVEDSRLLVLGAPNAPEDGVIDDED